MPNMKSIVLKDWEVLAGKDGQKTSKRILKKQQQTCKYEVGDVIYVKETWAEWPTLEADNPIEILYKADYANPYEMEVKWRSSIHMPREVARLFLRVTDVRTEHLQDITEAEMLQDMGEVECTDGYDYFKDEFKVVPYSEKFKFLLRAVWGRCWDKHIVKMREGYTWDANPWVFVISFERISKEEAEKNA